MERAEEGDAYDLESLVQFGVFPEDLGLCLREFWMVLVRIDLENLGGHMCPSSVVAIRRIWVTWEGLHYGSHEFACRSFVYHRRQTEPLVDDNNNYYYYYYFSISVNSVAGGIGPGREPGGPKQ